VGGVHSLRYFFFQLHLACVHDKQNEDKYTLSTWISFKSSYGWNHHRGFFFGCFFWL